MSFEHAIRFPPPHAVPPLPAPLTAAPLAAPSEEEIRHLVALAVLAPSGGNYQPWRWDWDGQRLRCSVDPARTAYFTNFRSCESFVSLGAAVLNAEVGARALGWEPELRLAVAGEAAPGCELRFRRSARPPGLEARRLAEVIPFRTTSRTSGVPRAPLSAGDRALLEETAASQGAGLIVVDDPAALARLGEIIGKLNHLGYRNQAAHAGIVKMLRWSDEEAEASRDGIPVKTFELSPVELTGLRFISNWQVMKFIDNMGAGRAIEGLPVAWAASASAMCLLTTPERGPEAQLRAGRALEAMWLEATRRGLAFHCLGVNSYFDRLLHGEGEGFDAAERELLREQRAVYEELLRIPPGIGEAVLFRVLPGNPNVERTLRRRLEDVLTVTAAAGEP